VATLKICRKFDDESIYNANGITAENGWIRSYDWKPLKKKMIVMYVILIAASVIFTNIFKWYYPEFNKNEFIRTVLLAVFSFLFVLTPVHELLHLAGSTRDFFGNKSYLVIGPFAVGVFYAGEMTRKRLCFSLILPFVTIAAVIAAAIVFASGNALYFLFFLLWCHTLGCCSDIYMFFYYCFGKKFSSKTRIFGIRYLNNQ
jgi:hypothetical protein